MEHEVIGKLEGSEYWYWRFLIVEMQHAETKVAKVEQTYALMEKEIELMRMRSHIFKEAIKQARDIHRDSKVAYDEYKLSLESKLELSLNDTVIDDVTFEIKKILENKE